MDRDWWRRYLGEARGGFGGAFVAPLPGISGVVHARVKQHNSGAGAIALAASLGAERIVLLGYDAQKTGGRAHWHGDHPEGMGNAGSVGKWPGQFDALAKTLRGVEIINCSRETALTCWPRQPLESVACST